MPTNDFKAIASSAGANVATQAAFAANNTLLTNGFPTGVVDSPTFNKAWRQSSFIAAAVAQFVADRSGQNVLDDGNLANFEALLVSAVSSVTTTGGVTGAFTLTPAPAITAYAAGQSFNVKFSADGNGSDTINVNGLGAKNLKQYAGDGSKTLPAIKNGMNATVLYDGTDFVIVDPLPSGFQAAGIVAASTTQTLTAAAHVGRLVYAAAGSPITHTLPLANTTPAGGAILIQNAGSTVTLNRNGTDSLNVNGGTITSVTIAAGDWLLCTSNGSNAWWLSGPACLSYSAQFANSLGANGSSGYQKLPGGLILQWATITLTANAGAVINWPIAFPSNIITAWTGKNDSGGSAPPSFYSESTTQITLISPSGGNARVFGLGK